MLLESNNGKMFQGFPLNKFRYRLAVGESCYAIRFVLPNKEELILKACADLGVCKKQCAGYNREYNISVHYIIVTRVSEEDYHYVSEANRGSKEGTFQQPAEHVDEYSLDYTLFYDCSRQR